MPTAEEFRKTISNSSAVHFAAGTVDLAAEKLRALPARLDQLRVEAPERLQSFRDEDLPRLRAHAQALAQQGVSVAQDCASKAREAYDELAERGRGPVEEWSARYAAESEDDDPEVVVERLDPAADEHGMAHRDTDGDTHDSPDDSETAGAASGNRGTGNETA